MESINRQAAQKNFLKGIKRASANIAKYYADGAHRQAGQMLFGLIL